MNSPPYPNHSHKSSRGTDCWLQSNATAEYKVMPPPAAAQSTIYCHQIPSGRPLGPKAKFAQTLQGVGLRMCEMHTPLMKDQALLTESDFDHYPVWVRAQDYDRDEPWFSETTEQTYRPWNGPLPLEPAVQFPFVLLAASFRLSCGDTYPGYFQPATEEWDTPLPPRKMRDGTFAKSLQWSSRRGGTPLSILAIHSPVVFIQGKAYDFHLRRDLERRKKSVLEFYEAIGKCPTEVFPVEFSADSVFFKGIVSGRLNGFYSFPLDKAFEIDDGERYLVETE